MTTIILPDHNLIRHPDIIANPRCPTFYADGGFSRPRGDVMHITFYAEVREGRPAREILFVVMTRANYERSMIIEALDVMPEVLGMRAN